LTLVIGAALFAFSLRNITNIDSGFRLEKLLLVSFAPEGTGYVQDRARLAAFYSAALDRVRSLPGVTAASLSSILPLSIEDTTRYLNVPGFTGRTLQDHAVHLNHVSAGFFETMRTTVLAGREFTTRDDDGAPRVAVVNETLARFYFGDREPVGKLVRLGREADAPPIEIVGVVRDSKHKDLREPPSRMIYLPFLQSPQPYMTLEVRTAIAPAALIPAVREALSVVNRDIPVRRIKTAQAQLESGLVQERLVATLASFFGGLALMLAALGLYGTLSHLVTRRNREIGVRMALGAERHDILRLVLSEAARTVSSGLAIGLLAAYAASSVLTKLLFELSPTHPAAWCLAIAVLLATSALAAYLPARRAARVDPFVALRQE
jgi:predicted permease